jgi:hypothetical protein
MARPVAEPQRAAAHLAKLAASGLRVTPATAPVTAERKAA